LTAHIDRLPLDERGLLQTAVVIGLKVPIFLLAIATPSKQTLHGSLARLQAAEFLSETRLWPQREYTFKHALTHEVAYGSLLREWRGALHRCIVEALEGRTGELMAEEAERLAHHAQRGEVCDKALVFYWQAGEKAMAWSADREAAVSFEQTLGALSHPPETGDRREQAIDLRLALRSPLSNKATRPKPSSFSARTPRGANPQTSSRLKSATGKPSL
jgi:predicted ATPase